jgi:hypothetical protein
VKLTLLVLTKKGFFIPSKSLLSQCQDSHFAHTTEDGMAAAKRETWGLCVCTRTKKKKAVFDWNLQYWIFTYDWLVRGSNWFLRNSDVNTIKWSILESCPVWNSVVRLKTRVYISDNCRSRKCIVTVRVLYVALIVSGTWRRVEWWKFTSVLGERVFIFTVHSFTQRQRQQVTPKRR